MWRPAGPLLAALLLCACATQPAPRPTEPQGNMPPAPKPGQTEQIGKIGQIGQVTSAASAATASAPAAPGAPAELPPPLDTRAVVVSPVNPSTAPATNIPQRPTNATLLAYGDKVRSLAPLDLQQEITRLGDTADPARQPSDDLQLAMALGQTRVSTDLVRAQGLLARVLANSQEDIRQLHPLARLLSARYAEQKRVEDLLDRQAQQLRDSQRRIDQLNDRLEAMRAIERSLTSRNPGAAPHNGANSPTGNGTRTPVP